jgi:hypothetical protein
MKKGHQAIFLKLITKNTIKHKIPFRPSQNSNDLPPPPLMNFGKYVSYPTPQGFQPSASMYARLAIENSRKQNIFTFRFSERIIFVCSHIAFQNNFHFK